MDSRSRSRSPRIRSESIDGSDRASPAPSSTSGTYKDIKKHQLIISCIPLSWTYRHVSTYIKKHTYPVDKAIAEDMGYISMSSNPHFPETQQASITFKHDNIRLQAFEKLKGVTEKIDGKKLYVKKVDAKNKNSILNKKFAHNNVRAPIPNKQFHPVNQNLIDFNSEEVETYGLSANYLSELGITSRPLTRWVFVRGLPEVYNNETKLREVFMKAGFIVSVAILESKSGESYNARVEYDHPVEAVQAVSMFNNREVLGSMIKCEMDFLRKKEFIVGISQGPGLGPDGKPMRGIRISVECKKIKNEFMQEIAKINDSLEELKAQVTNLYMEVENIKAEKKTAPVVQNTPTQNISNPLAALGTLLTNQLQPMLLQGLMPQSTGNDANPLASLLQNLTSGNMNLGNLLQQAQSGVNMQSGSSFQSGHDGMQGGPNNMQSGPNNLLTGPNNMQTGPNNIVAGPSNMPDRPNNMQGGPNNMQGGLNNMQGGPSYSHGGPNNMQRQNSFDSFANIPSGPHNQGRQNAFDQYNDAGFNMPNQPNNFGNMQSNFGPSNETKSKQKNLKCFKCGGTGHKAHACQVRSKKNPQTMERKPGFDMKVCHNCSQPGHIALECRNNPNQGQNQNNNQQQGGGVGNSNMLIFRNLPPAVTLQVLLGKMREVGDVKLVEMTGPGRALVSFCYVQDADKCIRLFNESKVDGQTIIVKQV